MFLKTLVVPAPEIEIPFTAVAPVELIIPVVLLLTFVTVAGLDTEIAVTLPPVPVEVIPVIILLVQVFKVEVPLELRLIHVMEPPLVV